MVSSSSRQEYGIIILGNSGVGKSFLANILLGREAFVHRVAPGAVTTQTDFEDIRGDNESCAIFDIPGLIEADQQRIEMNKREIDKAFVERPTSFIFYVFGGHGGRIRSEDVLAFNALNEAYPLKSESLVLIVNGVPKDRDENYEGQVIVSLKQLINVSFQSICILDMVDKNNQEERKNLKDKLFQAILERTPSYHIKTQDIELHTEKVRKITKEIQTLQLAFKQNKEIHEEEIKDQQTRYEKEIKDQEAMYHKTLAEMGEENDQMRQRIGQQAAEQVEKQAEQEARQPARKIKELSCKGHPCTTCGRCSDWYYAGDSKDWEWIRNIRNWSDKDVERWRNGDYGGKFQLRDGGTCNRARCYAAAHIVFTLTFGSFDGSRLVRHLCPCDSKNQDK